MFTVAKDNSPESQSLYQNLKELITATPEQLEEFIENQPDFSKRWDFTILYSTFVGSGLGKDKYKPIDFVKDFGINICPYCNRQYVNSARGIRIAELDHFYPQSATDKQKEKGFKAYPYLAMSFYNLIPSCGSCNRRKSNKRIKVSPYLIDNVDEYITFNYEIISADFITDQNQIDVVMDELTKGDESYKHRLALEEHYKIHNDYVYDLIKKKEAYDDPYLKELLKLGTNENEDIDTTSIEGLFNSKDELRRALWGNYTKKDELHKRPLAKLTRDILREIAPEALEDE